MNKFLGAAVLILVGYFGRMAVEFFRLGGISTWFPIETSDGNVHYFQARPGDVIKLQDDEIIIAHRDTSYITVVDDSPLKLLDRQLNGEKAFRGVQPDSLEADYRPETGIFAGLNSKTKKVIQDINVLDSKNRKINLKKQGYGKYIYACPLETIPNGIYKVQVYLKDTSKRIDDISRNFFVEWKYRVNAERPSGKEPPC